MRNQMRSSSRLSACLMARIFPCAGNENTVGRGKSSWTEVKSRTPWRAYRVGRVSRTVSLITRWLVFIVRWTSSDKQIWLTVADLIARCESRDSGRDRKPRWRRSNLLVKAETRQVRLSPVNPRRSRNLDGLRALRCYFTMRQRGERVKGHSRDFLSP